MAWSDPATGGQKRRIAILARANGIMEEIEQQPMTRAVARTEIYILRNRLRKRR